MSGQEESKTHSVIDSKRSKINDLINKYQREVGIGILEPNNEVHKYLTMKSYEQNKMSAEDCGEASVVLSQSALYVQLEINKTQADIKWCNTYIEYIIAKNISNVGGKYTPFEYRRVLAIQNDDVAMRLQSIINTATTRLESLQYIPNQLRGVSSAFSELQQTKRGGRQQHGT